MLELDYRQPITTPFASSPDPFADAEAIYRCAVVHLREFKQRSDPKNWVSIQLMSPANNGDAAYCTLGLNKSALADMKVIVFDVAVKFRHALDLALAACARANGQQRLKDFHYPYYPGDDDGHKFKGKIQKFIKETKIGDAHGDVLISARMSADGPSKRAMAALVSIANSCKHWELTRVTAKIFVLQIVDLSGKQSLSAVVEHSKLAQNRNAGFAWPAGIPRDAPIQIVTKLALDLGQSEADSLSASAVLHGAQRYVRTQLDVLRQAQQLFTPPP